MTDNQNTKRVRQALHIWSDALHNLQADLKTSLGDEKKNRNSALLTFVLAFEATWKAFKHLLLTEAGIDAASPKEVMRAAYQQGWLGDHDALWLKMVDDRNRIAHTYHEAEAIAIYDRVVNQHTPAISAAYQKIKQQYVPLFSQVDG